MCSSLIAEAFTPQSLPIVSFWREGKTPWEKASSSDDFGLIQPDFGKLGDQVRRPAIDVVFFHNGTHAAHPGAALFRLHLKREADGLRQLFRIVGIHPQIG